MEERYLTNGQENYTMTTGEEKFVPSGLVEDWRFRYRERWANDFHIQMLEKMGIISEREGLYIRTGM